MTKIAGNADRTYGKELLIALGSARREMDDPAKSGRNSHMKYEYAKYEDIVKATAPYLMKHGLIITETKKENGMSHEILITTLNHIESGQFIECTSIINRHANDQDWGKSITYAKKYAYGTLVGISCSEDSDADIGYISKEQYVALSHEFSPRPDLLPTFLNLANIAALQDLPASNFDRALNWIRKQKGISGSEANSR